MRHAAPSASVPARGHVTPREMLTRGRVLAGAERQHLGIARAGAVHGDALESETPALEVRPRHRVGGRMLGQVDRLGHRVVDVALERVLDREVPVDVELGRRHEQPAHLVGKVRDGGEGAGGSDRSQKRRRVHAVPHDPALEDRIELEERRPAQRVRAAVGERIERLDARAGAGQDAERPRGRDRQQRGVASPVVTGAVRALWPGREGAALVGERARGRARLVGDQADETVRPRDRRVTAVGDTEQEKTLREAHHAEPDLARSASGGGDRGKGIAIDLDDVVEEAHARPHRMPQALLVETGDAMLEPHHVGEVHGAEDAALPREQRDLATGVGGLDGAERRGRVGAGDRIEVEETRVARLPGCLHDRIEHGACRESPGRAPVTRMDQLVAAVRDHGLHEAIGHRHREVEVGEGSCDSLGADELEDVRVVDAQGAHVGAAPPAPQLDVLRRAVEHPHEGDGPGRLAAGRGDDVARRAQAREAEATAPTSGLEDRHRMERAEDPVHRILDRQHEAGAELTEGRPGIHERRGIRQEVERAEEVRERLLPPIGGGRGAEQELRLRDGARHALDELPRFLDDPAGAIAAQIARLEHADGIRRELDHVGSHCSDPASAKCASRQVSRLPRSPRSCGIAASVGRRAHTRVGPHARSVA